MITTLVRPPNRTGVVRDPSVDAVRVGLLAVVLVLHATMCGVSVGVDGPVLRNTLEHQGWFGPVSWVVQIMPLFFVVGGFSSLHHWRAVRARGATAADYVRTRLDRLVRPAVVLVVVVAGALGTAGLLRLPADLVATAGFRIGQPLWFLAVYIGVSALVPVMAAAHERAPVRTPLVLLTGVVLVDVVRWSTGLDAIGLANLLLVWLLVQQLGFHLADGTLDRFSRRTLWGTAGTALGVLGLLTTIGPYPVDMLTNLNPPTLCLVVLGVAQLALFDLGRPALRRWARRPGVTRVVGVVGERSMTVYLWHMPVLVLLAGLSLVAHATAGLALPEPLTAAWWVTRPVWLAAGVVALLPVVAATARFERGRAGRPVVPLSPESARRRAAASAIDAACGVAGVAVLLVAGFGPVPATAALALLLAALRGCRPGSRQAARSRSRASMSAKPSRFRPRQAAGSSAAGSAAARPMPQTRSRGLASTSTRSPVPSR